MKRRGFLGTVLAGVAGFALDPDMVLWVPGEKTIFIPKPVVQKLSGVAGVCGGLLISWDDIDQSRVGPLIWNDDHTCAHRIVELKRTVSHHGNTIFAIPNGKLRLQVYGRTSLPWLMA